MLFFIMYSITCRVLHHTLFYLFSFYIIVFKTVFKFYSSRGIKKIKEKETVVRSIILFLFFRRRQGEILSPLSLILFINYKISVCKPDFCIRYHLLSGYIWFASSVDAEKNMLRDVNWSFFSYNQTWGTFLFMHITIICSKFSMRFTAWVTFSSLFFILKKYLFYSSRGIKKIK